MTTSWSLATHGHLAEAARIHATGTLLAGVALVVGLAAVTIAVRGRRPAWAGGDWLAALSALGLAAAVLCEWVWRHWMP
jgi:hypothetical protein